MMTNIKVKKVPWMKLKEETTEFMFFQSRQKI